jgi:hypothetical protein
MMAGNELLNPVEMRVMGAAGQKTTPEYYALAVNPDCGDFHAVTITSLVIGMRGLEICHGGDCKRG